MSVPEDRVVFGSGKVYLKNAAGTRLEVGQIKAVEFGVSVNEVAFEGTYSTPIDKAVIKREFKGKVQGCKFDAPVIAEILGGTLTAGAATQQTVETKTIASNTITLSQTPTSSGCQKVTNSSGAVLQETSGSPAAGVSYSRAGTTLTFHASETGAITVEYGYALNTGYKIAIDGARKTIAPRFEIIASSYVDPSNVIGGGQRAGKVFRLKIFSATFAGWGAKLSLEQWAENGEHNFEAMIDDDGHIAEISIA